MSRHVSGMDPMRTRSRLSRLLAGFFLTGGALMLQGSKCISKGVQPAVDQVGQSFDNALATLNSNSAQWQATLQGLENNLIAQGQTTLANQVQSVINRGVATASGEFRCDVAFLAAGLGEALRDILARFRGQSPAPPPPRFCTIDPSVIDLGIAPAQRPASLNVYGFNLKQSNLSVAVVDQDGTRHVPMDGIFTVPTEFLATFNIRNYAFTQQSRYVSVNLNPGGESRIGIAQAATCGGVGQPCCTVGAACVASTGCLDHLCVTCPPPAVPPQPRVLFTKGNEFAGNNCGGQDVDRRYGGACANGYHREQCSVSIVDACGSECSAVGRWATANTSDCTCIVHFKTPRDCFKGIHVNISISQTQNVAPRPAGCP
jgi:hypothetical protein